MFADFTHQESPHHHPDTHPGHDRRRVLWCRLPGLLARAAAQARRLGPEVPLVVVDGRLVRDVSPGAMEEGITAGLSLLRARRLCPALLAVPIEQVDAGRLSRALWDTLAALSPCVEPIGPDAVCALLEPGDERLVEKLMGRFGRLRPILGVGATKLVARTVAEIGKPFDAAPSPLLWHQDPAVGGKLLRLGLPTVLSVVQIGESALRYQFGRRVGSLLHRRARGLDDNPVRPLWPPPSVEVSRRFDLDPLESAVLVDAHLVAISERASSELRRLRRWGRGVALAVTTERGESSRAWRPPWPVQSTGEILRCAHRLLELQPPRAPVTGLVLRIEALELPPAESLSLLDDGRGEASRRLASASELLSARYGSLALRRGSQLPVDLRDRRRQLVQELARG